MQIVVINGSLKGEFSITLHTCLYIEKRFPEHAYSVLHVGEKLRTLEKDPASALVQLAAADLILFAYPVYTFLAPSQLHRFLEILKESGVDLRGKYATQITTSKHYYDVTAHRFIEDNCADLGLQYIRGLSQDMDDLTKPEGRKDAEAFFRYVLHCMEAGLCEPPSVPGPSAPAQYVRALEAGEKRAGKETVIVADHQFYKQHGIYDFPQKQKGKLLFMLCAGKLMNNPKLRKKMGGKLREGMIAPYRKALAEG